MSKMYAECDDDDKDSLNSSFWSDGEHEDEEEVERLVGKKALKRAEELLLEAPEEEKSDVKESKVTDQGSDGTDGDDEEGCSSCHSPGLSLMTSGYGTYRPEEEDAGDCTADQVDQDSRGDLSELRDDEDDDDRRSVCSHFCFKEPGATLPQSLSPEPGGPAAAGGEVKISEEGEFNDDGCEDEERFTRGEKTVEGGRVDAAQHESPEEEQQLQDAAESDEPKESPCEQDIRFIDSEDSRNAASCLEERLAELRLSAPHDSEAEDQAARSWSDEDEETLSDAFESYVGGLPRSDGGLRPKPKSFIRPLMNQKTLKKTDPVAKYFQYKRLWDVFKLPGEADRAALRLEIKERLAYQPPPPKPRRVYVPNTYTVPTEKKRSALRWRIRSHLASGIVPYKLGC